MTDEIIDADVDNITQQDWTCERCGDLKSSKCNLLKHLRNKTPCSVKNSNINPEEYIAKLLHRQYNEKTYDCKFCKTKFNAYQNRHRHMKSCKAFIEYCNKRAKTMEELQQQVIEIRQELYEIKEENIELKDENLKLQEECTHLRQLLEGKEESSTIEILQPKKKKTKIPQARRIQCWNTYIGDEIGKTKCLCCKIIDITPFSFQCGHVTSEANGGDVSLENLRPICDKCNNDMGIMDMREYAQFHFQSVI